MKNKLIHLINLWDQPDPPVRLARTGPAGPSVGSAGGSGGPRQDPAKRRKGEGSGRSVGASERKLRPHQAVVPDNSEVPTSRRKVEDWLTQIAVQQDTKLEQNKVKRGEAR